MNILRLGSRGPQVQLLQLALLRGGFSPGEKDGVFGPATLAALKAFQVFSGLSADGIAGPQTNRALYPYYVGYISHTVRPGDTLYRLSEKYGSTVRAIEIANPRADPFYLQPGSVVIVPLPFTVVPTDIAYSSTLIGLCCRGLSARYPFIRLDEMGKSVMGAPLYTLTLGSGGNRVFYNASHHANEWITTPLLLKFCEDLARAYAYDGNYSAYDVGELLSATTVCIAPAVNPDGIDLVSGYLSSGPFYRRALRIAEDYPFLPFPSGWKANIVGTDLNLQYPAGWEQAREIKFSQGFVSPAPRDYVGTGPLSAPESRAVYEFTRSFSPALTLSYHTQGRVIFWRYLDYEPPESLRIANAFADVSGYRVENTPYASGFAGYKDWFIQAYNLPGYTIEAGFGDNPLPLSQFDTIYADNAGILALGLQETVSTV